MPHHVRKLETQIEVNKLETGEAELYHEHGLGVVIIMAAGKARGWTLATA